MTTIYPLGILAGMGPYSTAPFLNHVLDACKKLYGVKSDLDFPHIIIYSLPTPYHPEDKECKVGVVECLEIGINALINAGSKIIAVPCNSVHRYYDVMRTMSRVPVLNIIDETIAKIKNSKNVICIMATRATIEAGLYQSKLRSKGQEVFWNEILQKQVDKLVASFKVMGVNATTLNIWKEIEDILNANNISEVVIGCTDLFFCAAQSQTLKFYDSSVILAEKLVKEYLSHLGLKEIVHE